MLVLPILDRSAIPFLRRFESLGRRSYGIYLTHFVLINIAVIVTSRPVFRLARTPLLVYPAFLVAALGLSLALMNAMARAVPTRRIYRYVFGIVPPAA
jgi:peptidoglycan/LPS O-acetylase OafA/YrhL